MEREPQPKTHEIATKKQDLIPYQQAYDIAHKKIEIYDAEHGIHKHVTPANKDEIINQLKKELKQLPGYTDPKEVEVVPKMEGSSSVDTNKEDTTIRRPGLPRTSSR